MTSIINNGNENNMEIIDENNKENCHNNLDEFINKQIKIAKDHSKIKQDKINKGLKTLDQNIDYLKNSTTVNHIRDETNIDNQNSKTSPLKENNSISSNPKDNKYCDCYISIIDIKSFPPELNNDNMEFSSKPKEKKESENLSLSPLILPESDTISKSEQKKITKNENINKLQIPLIPLNIDINKMFRKRESENLLLKFGDTSFKYNKILEETVFNIPSNFLDKHQINPCIRTRMVDWMIEVLSIFNATEETFFLSINIMDLYFWKTESFLKDEDVHLIGVASMFIASKFQEIFPISLFEFVHKIGHDQFLPCDVKKMEFNILKDIKPECLVSTSIYDFSKTYFYDFYNSNKNLILNEEEAKIYNYIKLTSIYLNKLILHYEYFYQDICSLKAIGCILTSFKIVSDNLKEKFTLKEKGIYIDWILFLIKKGGFDKQKVEVLAAKIYSTYLHYQTSKCIDRNLNRFSPLPYIE